MTGLITHFSLFLYTLDMEDRGHRPSALVGNSRNGYARSGKVMLASIIVVFSLIIIIACFHSYANRSRRRHLRRTRHRRHISPTFTDNTSKLSDALDSSVLKSLPTFLYSTTHGPPLECAVCLSEFESNESGRVLPNCNHCFHSQCIDMWFESQSTCPLCRAPVKPIEFTALSIDDEPVNRGLCEPGRMRSSASTPALGGCLGLEILGICIEEVPSSMDSGCSRSPRDRDGVLSLKRIWSF